MHAYPGVDSQSVLGQTENLQHPLWFADEIHVVQKGKKFFTFSEEIAGAGERRVHGETEEQWHEGITLVATLSLRCVLNFSNLVLPNVQRKLPVKPSHERQNTITCVSPSETAPNAYCSVGPIQEHPTAFSSPTSCYRRVWSWLAQQILNDFLLVLRVCRRRRLLSSTTNSCTCSRPFSSILVEAVSGARAASLSRCLFVRAKQVSTVRQFPSRHFVDSTTV